MIKINKTSISKLYYRDNLKEKGGKKLILVAQMMIFLSTSKSLQTLLYLCFFYFFNSLNGCELNEIGVYGW